jgi:hypothetical protein
MTREAHRGVRCLGGWVTWPGRGARPTSPTDAPCDVPVAVRAATSEPAGRDFGVQLVVAVGLEHERSTDTKGLKGSAADHHDALHQWKVSSTCCHVRYRSRRCTFMAHLVETRWTRFGHDRVYLKTAEGAQIGHVDLKSGSVTVENEEFASALTECRDRWVKNTALPPPTGSAVHPPASSPLVPPSAVVVPPPPRDLATNAAGAAARAKRDEVNAEAPVLNFVARVLGVKTDERNWRVGAKGEEKVAKELQKLGPHWRVLHAVEVGDRGSDIDHIVIGPAGIFTLNTKRHPSGKVWVADRSVRVNNQRTYYLRNSRHEGGRASRLLSAAHGSPIDVHPVIVFVDLSEFDVKQQPADVHVTTRKQLVDWLEALPIVWDSATIEGVFATARLSTTWSS